MAQYQTATEVLNQVAAEVGLTPTADPFSSADSSFTQLRYLLNTSGLMLLTQFEWEKLQYEHSFTTDSRVPQNYELPADFYYMINQTGWMRDQNVPLAGPLNAQEWQYLLGRNLVTSTIYASFRLNEGLLKLFPYDDSSGQLVNQEISYEYVSRNWVQPTGETDPAAFRDSVQNGTDIILYPTPLITLFLKGRYLMSKGMSSQAADANAEFSQQFVALTGVNKSAPVLNAARGSAGYGVPYLNSWTNVPFTNYGIGP